MPAIPADTAVTVPSPVTIADAALVSAATAAATAGGGAPCTPGFSVGDSMGVASKLNNYAGRIDLLAALMVGGAACVLGGLAVTAAGLVATVAPGHAVAGGLIELAAATDCALIDNSVNYVWLKQDGSLVVQTTTAAPGGLPGVFLGRIVTTAGAPGATSVAGVLFWRGAGVWRTTADAGAPGDSPPATMRLFTTTAGGVYVWEGATHRAL